METEQLRTSQRYPTPDDQPVRTWAARILAEPDRELELLAQLHRHDPAVHDWVLVYLERARARHRAREDRSSWGEW